MLHYSVVIPAKNEAIGIGDVIRKIANLDGLEEVIVVNDGSADDTAAVAEGAGAKVISHPYSKGNGAAIKTGAKIAKSEIIVFMDGDGQHRPEDIPKLLRGLNAGYDMIVGARNQEGQAGWHRLIANGFYNRFASWMVGHRIEDLTSGFRAVRRTKFLEFISLLPNKFSYPTTITMSFFRAGYSVGYEPVTVLPRAQGSKSHISLWKDGLRFLLIIFKIGTLFSPLKLFFPISLMLGGGGVAYYSYTYLTDGRFTNMGVLLFTTSILVFLMGLVSEQITALMYREK
ncbi:glycosyltransferase family 2 protein [Marinobacter nauticus]|uniref:Glycosyltransferase involved in cell wall biosynthesis n=1 Tax=Marinobacter nauticus TaxID=2743 RepID=A0A368V3M4_MARNT|nr:glycosyltransferase family 2 protein [Marinobacter nauticus]RBP72684.1 glycosyltransferase involved in cell wall biosynthesis [Marinobacter nauticus]RCW33611.1 glycosyltransferase involved in cell wall biosynthesis [Marinobacter nauticus]